MQQRRDSRTEQQATRVRSPAHTLQRWKQIIPTPGITWRGSSSSRRRMREAASSGIRSLMRKSQCEFASLPPGIKSSAQEWMGEKGRGSLGQVTRSEKESFRSNIKSTAEINVFSPLPYLCRKWRKNSIQFKCELKGICSAFNGNIKSKNWISAFEILHFIRCVSMDLQPSADILRTS